MLRQSIPPHQQAFESSSDSHEDLQLNRSLLLDIVQENHLLYHMEKRDRPNNMIRILVELHQLGASQEQLTLAYGKARQDAQPIRISNRIDQTNWEEFLGNWSLYGDYLVFFDNQLSILGLEETLNRYFYSIPKSLGSQLQPLVQLAFGIEHDLPLIITQALAYYATSYLDVGSILDYCQHQTNTSKSTCTANTILFDYISSDQRFDGKMEGNNTFHSAVKLLIKSKSDLIKTYMHTWSTSSPGDMTEQLESLLETATRLTQHASRQPQENVIDLDWFMAGGQMMDAVFAVKRLIRSENDQDLVDLLFLSMLCTFVVQGRPALVVHKQTTGFMKWEDCISTIVQSAEPKSILALASIVKASHYNPTPYLSIANTLAQFVLMDGTWVKGGIGWSK
ncbi:uncharacterized protein EV154DRAFT_270223 [Mucor mucedo]|uniref:uncharacterized protein n=1 Tax=Mucor mucedo TaxID=29922 RepID=UPI00221F3719|nr:uncharacterized protein EV154DRAFT_270223 [Mucor mucedo]KAI7889807.1 hypothetical protein EV154DRAFT_270223 [Mucor mucedo]